MFVSALLLLALTAPPAEAPAAPPTQRVLVLDVEVVGTDAVDASAATRVMAAAAAEVHPPPLSDHSNGYIDTLVKPGNVLISFR